MVSVAIPPVPNTVDEKFEAADICNPYDAAPVTDPQLTRTEVGSLVDPFEGAESAGVPEVVVKLQMPDQGAGLEVMVAFASQKYCVLNNSGPTACELAVSPLCPATVDAKVESC